MGGIFEVYRRWRHTRGYGVHSPFAFSLVELVVHPQGIGWYGYQDIDQTFYPGLPDRRVRRQARLLLRLTVALRPKSVFLPLGIHPAYHAALAAADSHMRISRRPADAPNCRLICSQANHISLPVLLKHMELPGNMIAISNIPADWVDQIFDAMPEGLLLEGKHNIFAINRSDMAKLRYSICI